MLNLVITLKSHFYQVQIENFSAHQKEDFLSFSELTQLSFISSVFICKRGFNTVHYSIQRRDANKRMQFFHIAKRFFLKKILRSVKFFTVGGEGGGAKNLKNWVKKGGFRSKHEKFHAFF